jgi:phenylalanyl-tRNA synthetase beta chain
MKLSLDWLKEFVDIRIPLSQLLDSMNMIGLVVEGWEAKDGDVILDVETYANRPDTLGHLGVAREIAAALGLPLREKSWPLAELDRQTSDLVDVQIWDEDMCPRYSGLIVKDIQVSPSPLWLQKKIEAMGLKPINNVVDTTNYVLFATAQPIHAFDLAKIAGKKIIVRRAKKGEILRTLEGKDAVLSGEMLVIADEAKPMALAGVIGGEESAVTVNTRDVFIECACFDPISVRLTSKATGIQTDASYRFERGTDVSFPPRAASIAGSLLTGFGGRTTRGIIDVYPKPKRAKSVVLRHLRICDLLGVQVDSDFVPKILTSLGFKADSQQLGIWRVEIPFFRVDIEREADLIEEIARFFGYEKIPAVVTPLKAFEPAVNKKRDRIDKVRCLLFQLGFDEALNFSFADPEREALLQSGRPAISLRNPVSARASLLRTNILQGLLENTNWNKNRGIEGIHLFEIGNIYFWNVETHCEEMSLGLVTTGSTDPVHWRGEKSPADFYSLKGALEALLGQLRYEPFSFEEAAHPYFEKGYSLAIIYKGEKVGFLGLVKQAILEGFSLKEAVYGAEVNLSLLFGKQPQPFEYHPVTKYPPVVRDLSFLISRGVPYQDVEKAIGKLAIPQLESFELYDLFEGRSIPEDKISLTLRFTYRHPQRTLLTEEVDKFEGEMVNHLKQAFRIQLR